MNQRLEWADVARAAAIALVVLYHVGVGWIQAVVTDIGATGAFIAEVNAMLLTVRMPLFFLVSGMLATRALERRWRDVRRGRVIDLLWPYLIWSLAFAPCWAFAYGAGWVDVPLALGWILDLSGAYWYLPLLVLFFLVTWIAGRHRKVVLGVAIGMWLVAPALVSVIPALPGGLTVYRFMTFFVWFVAGATLRPALNRVADAPVVLGLALAAGWTVLSYYSVRFDWSVLQVLNVLGVGAAVVLCGAAARIPRVPAIGRFIGGRTLVIYLAHPLVLALIAIAMPTLPGGDLVSLALIVLLTVLLTVGPALLRPYLPEWLFRFPLPVGRAERVVLERKPSDV